MTYQPSSPVVVSSPLREPAGAGNVFRAMVARYRNHLERRRQRRAFDGIAEMNDHLLKDIGALDSLISRSATRMETAHQTRFEIGR
jgi:uncharacterized protein YjiS (DUF1127 family)